MARNIPAPLLAAMAAETFAPLILVEAQFVSGTFRIWNGVGDKTVDSLTYTGAGDLLGISEAEETSEVVARGMTLSLSGVPSAMLSLALDESFQNRKLIVSIGSDGIEDTAILFSGRINTYELNESANTATISVTVDNDLALLDRVVNRRYTDRNQKRRYPNDKAFEFVTDTDRVLNWGG